MGNKKLKVNFSFIIKVVLLACVIVSGVMFFSGVSSGLNARTVRAAGETTSHMNEHSISVSNEKDFLRHFTTVDTYYERDENGMAVYYPKSNSEKVKEFWDYAAKNVTLNNDIVITGSIKHFEALYGSQYKVYIYGDTYLDLNGHTLDMSEHFFNVCYSGDYTLTIKDSSPDKTGKIVSTRKVFHSNTNNPIRYFYKPGDDYENKFVNPSSEIMRAKFAGLKFQDVHLENLDWQNSDGYAFTLCGGEAGDNVLVTFDNAYFKNYTTITDKFYGKVNLKSIHTEDCHYIFNIKYNDAVSILPCNDNDKGTVIGVANGNVENWFSWVALLGNATDGFDKMDVYERAIPLNKLGKLENSYKPGEIILPVELNYSMIPEGKDTIKVFDHSEEILSTDKDNWTGKLNFDSVGDHRIWLKVKNKGLMESVTGDEQWETLNNYNNFKGWEFSTDPYYVYYKYPYSDSGWTDQKRTIYDMNEPVPTILDPYTSGDEFLGWYKEPEFINKWNFDTDRATGDVTLYGKYRGYGFKSDITLDSKFIGEDITINLANYVHNKVDKSVLLQKKSADGQFVDVEDVKGKDSYTFTSPQEAVTNVYRLKIEEQFSNEFTLSWIKDPSAPNDDGTYDISIINVNEGHNDGVVYNSNGEVIDRARPGEIVKAVANLIAPDHKGGEYVLGFICWQGWMNELNVNEEDGMYSPTITFVMPAKHLQLQTTYKNVVMFERENAKAYASDGREIGGTTYGQKVTIKADGGKTPFDHWEISVPAINEVIGDDINKAEFTFTMPSITVGKVVFKAIYKSEETDVEKPVDPEKPTEPENKEEDKKSGCGASFDSPSIITILSTSILAVIVLFIKSRKTR